MKNVNAQYVPILKWRQGEYQSLYRLDESVKSSIFPLINIPPIEYDFEEKRLKKSANDHVEPFPKRYSLKWGNRGAFLDFDETLHNEFMDDGTSVMNYVYDELNDLEYYPIPVTGISRSKNYQAIIKAVHRKNNVGLALRITFEEIMDPDIDKHITKLLKQHSLKEDKVDLILDLAAPESFEPYKTFARALAKRIRAISNLKSFRTVILGATSIKISDVNPPGALMPRHEWRLYKELCNEMADIRLPLYGDYCVELPGYVSLDMRFVNSAGKIIYTTEEDWYIRKGSAFRGNEVQMVQHCIEVIGSGYYKNKEYSWGDEVIYKTANELELSKSRTIWKQVGFSHHMTLVVNQLSSHHAS